MSGGAASADIEAGMTVELPMGLPGLGAGRRFTLEDLDGLAPFRKLRCLDREGLELVVAPPGHFFPDYVVEVDEDSAELLGLARAEDATVLVIITVPTPPERPTANLLGPIVLNPSAGRAVQIVQHGSDYALQAPLPGR